MREMLFRGKRICENKEWVEGCLLNLDEDSGHVFIVPFFRQVSTMPISRIVEYTSLYVDPETVGQFTGLTDKNGKKIFEGDIVRCIRTHCDGKEVVGHIIFRSCCFCIKRGIDSPAMDLCSDFEVIGNVHDNGSCWR